MTVRLKVQYGKFSPNTNLTTGPAEEARLLREGLADTNTAVGVAYYSDSETRLSGPASLTTRAGMSAIVAGRHTFGAGPKGKPKHSGRLYAFSDSITLGEGPAAVTSAYPYLLAARKGLKLTNLSVSGTIAERWVEGQIGSLPIDAGDIFVGMAGFNNARFAGSDATQLTQFKNVMLATLAWMSVPDSCKVYTQVTPGGMNYNPQFNINGAWSLSTTWIGQQAISRCGLYTSTVGNYLETVVDGDTVDVMLGGQSGVASACSIWIDGVRLGSAGTISPRPLAAPCDGGAEVWQPFCVRVPGLTPGRHTVRVTVEAAAILLVGYVAGFYSDSQQLPIVYVGNTIRMTTAGYAVSPANATDAVMRLYQDALASVCQTLASEGRLVKCVDFDGAFPVTPGGINADTVHPLEVGHAQIEQALLREVNRPAL